MPRLFDIAAASLALILLAPVLLLIALAILCLDGGPVLFPQRRVGQGGKSFVMVKFRSLGPDGRPTAVGTVLRRYSLDELPEFFNVLKGDMAIVGPRPMVLSDQPSLQRVRALRQRMRPGITGLAQVSGRNALSFEDTYRLDLWYGRHRSVWLDLYILAVTLPCVLSARGACALAPMARPASKRARKAAEAAP